MNEALQTSRPETCGDSRSAIFSQESPVGVSPSIAQESPQLDLFGQALAPAKISVAPAKEKASKVKEIYGRTSFGSSASAGLTECLASRLKTRLDTVGSTVYRQIWKRKVTPLGRSFWEHTARARTTKDSDFTGWPTPQACLGPNTSENRGKNYGGKRARKTMQSVEAILAGWPTPISTDAIKHGAVSPRPGAMGLSETAPMAGWMTPKCPSGGAAERTSKGGSLRKLEDQAELLCGWKTPHASDGEGGVMEMRPDANGHYKLRDMAQMVGWCSPASRDFKDTPGMATMGLNPDGSERSRVDQLPRQAMQVTSGQEPSPSPAATIASGVLNPAFSRWLQSFPEVWCQAAILAYRVMQAKRAKRVSCGSKGTGTRSA